MEILLATNNQGKIREMKEMMGEMGITVYSLKDKGIVCEVEEDGTTFEENAIKKASEISRLSGMITVSDDSGIEIYALDMRPGIYSARYAGENPTDEEMCAKVLEEMEGKTDRRARYVSVVALVYPDGKTETFRGECYGTLTHKREGTEGFGYDPIFYYEDFGKTLGQVSLEQKNTISHRAKALNLLKEYLKMQNVKCKM